MRKQILSFKSGSFIWHEESLIFGCLFDLILYVLVNNLSVMLGLVFLG